MSAFTFTKTTNGFIINKDGFSRIFNSYGVSQSVSGDSVSIIIEGNLGGSYTVKTTDTVNINGTLFTGTALALGTSLSNNVFNGGGGNGSTGVASNWDGKKIMVIGDSYFADNYVTPYLNTYLKATYINKSVGNTTVTPGYKTVGQSYWDRVQAPGYIAQASPDLVIIWGSVNEPFGAANGPVPIGTISDAETGTPTTFYGALKQVVLKAIAEAPNARILLTTNVIVLQTASRGTYSTQKGYRDAIIAVGLRYGIPVLDLQAESGFTFETNATWLLSDQVHPTVAGGNVLARMLTNKIKTM